MMTAFKIYNDHVFNFFLLTSSKLSQQGCQVRVPWPELPIKWVITPISSRMNVANSLVFFGSRAYTESESGPQKEAANTWDRGDRCLLLGSRSIGGVDARWGCSGYLAGKICLVRLSIRRKKGITCWFRTVQWCSPFTVCSLRSKLKTSSIMIHIVTVLRFWKFRRNTRGWSWLQ